MEPDADLCPNARKDALGFSIGQYLQLSVRWQPAERGHQHSQERGLQAADAW
jgi:hypothetical protein